MSIDMTVLLYLGNMSSDSGAFLESGYITTDNISNNIFTGEIGCYSDYPNFSWDNRIMNLSAIFVGY